MELQLPKFSPTSSFQGEPGSDEPSGATTPNISETAQHLRRSLSLSGITSGQLGKDVGSKLWRAQDEEAKMPGDWERLMVHVVRAGLRAGTLAFGLRATLSLVFALLKGLRTK